MVQRLVEKSSGQFIYAATVVRYVESPRHRPDQRLYAIFNLRPPFKDLPFTELDALYRHIISKADDLPTVLDIIAFPALYVILQLEQGTVEVMLADLHSVVTISSYTIVTFLHKSLADFLSEPQRAGDLYQDLSTAHLSHLERTISMFSTHYGQETDVTFYMLLTLHAASSEVDSVKNLRTGHVPSTIVQAIQQFPMFMFSKPLLTYGRTRPQHSLDADYAYLQPYLHYLHYIKAFRLILAQKDVSEAMTLVYWEQMRQYCECVLTVLDDHWSGDWKAHLVYAYYHLLHGAQCSLPRKLSHLDLHSDLDMDVGAFGETIQGVMARPLSPYPDEIAKLSRDLTDTIRQGSIFAMSASFCLASLCDERSAGRDADRIYGISGNDRYKKRERPWRWRQMVSRSFGDRLAMVVIRKHWHIDYKIRLTTIQKAFRNTSPNESTRIITMREYFRHKSKLVPDTWPMALKTQQPQQWPLYIFLLDLLPHILPLAGSFGRGRAGGLDRPSKAICVEWIWKKDANNL
ncbi:hypothetical protein CPC08DRAFT_724297 [Agrocybe pediades]|nr:hypothetical protein CPC08DRAFT_724297 [Agrocybe pediades]